MTLNSQGNENNLSEEVSEDWFDPFVETSDEMSVTKTKMQMSSPFPTT